MADTGGRLAGIQMLRGIAVLLVMAIHIWANENRAAGDPVLSVWLYHGGAGVDLFFVISGFIMVHVTRSKGGAVAAGSFLFARASRIYPLAWLFTTLAIAGFVLQGTLDSWLSGRDLAASYLLYPDALEPVLGVSWTLVHELYFYLAFAVLLILPRALLPFGLVLWGAVVGAGHYLGWAEINPWTRVALHPLTFEFLAGAFAGLLLHAVRPLAPGLMLLLGIAAFVGGALWIGEPVPEAYPAVWGRVIAFGPGATLIVYGVAGLEQQGRFRPPGFLVALGDWSYSLYLSHLLVIAALAHLWMRFAQPGLLDNAGMILAMIIVPILVAAATHYLVERPVLRLSQAVRKSIFGPRVRPPDV